MSYIYVVQMDIPAEYEAELNRVYDAEHVPMLSKVPGVRKVTRYRLEQSNDSRMQKYLAIYENGRWPAPGATGRPRSALTPPAATTAFSRRSDRKEPLSCTAGEGGPHRRRGRVRVFGR
jgi:hypothetical protein